MSSFVCPEAQPKGASRTFFPFVKGTVSSRRVNHFVFRGYTLFNDTTRCFMGFNPIFRYAEQNCDWSVAVSLKIVEDKKLLVILENISLKLSLGFEIKTDGL